MRWSAPAAAATTGNLSPPASISATETAGAHPTGQLPKLQLLSRAWLLPVLGSARKSVARVVWRTAFSLPDGGRQALGLRVQGSGDGSDTCLERVTSCRPEELAKLGGLCAASQ